MVSNVDNDNYRFSGIQSPVNCNTLKIITLYCLVSMIVSVLLNSLLIITLITWHRHLRKPFNLLLLALSSINLIGSLSEFPVVIISSYECKWLFKKLGCQISGFLMYFTGCTGLFLVTFMSYERYYTLSEPYRLKIMQTKMVVLIILFCMGFSLFWTITPLIGWSHYSLEGALISCSVEWAERTFNVLSYNITMFIFVFVAPYLTILLSNGYLIRVIRNVSSRRLNNHAIQNNRHTVRKRLRVEKNITISVIFIIVAFSITWFPYAIVSLYAAFSSNPIHPLITTLPSMFAKSSMYWSPAMFIVSNKNVRRIIKRNFLICFRVNR